MPDYNALVVIDQQGETMLVKSGGTISIESGGQLENAGGINAGAVLQTSTPLVLTAEDSGKTIISGVAELVVTLPPTELGLTFKFVALTLSASLGLSVSPDADDQIAGMALTPAADKDVINSFGTDVVGDTLEIVGDGADGWVIFNYIGTWAREG